MATWTDSRLKDFLRHPIGYLNGDRALALEGVEADAYFKKISEQAHEYVKSLPVDLTSMQLFDGAHLSPQAADIYKASLSRNVQDTNDALDRIGGKAEPEQQAYNKQADPLDLKLDRAGEAAYQQTLRANGHAMTDSLTTKTWAEEFPLHAAVESEDAVLVQKLLNSGNYDVLAKDTNDKLAINYAEEGGSWDCYRFMDEAYQGAAQAAQRGKQLEAALPQVAQPKAVNTGDALQAAWASTQPTKENLEAVKPAQVAPSLTTGKRARF